MAWIKTDQLGREGWAVNMICVVPNSWSRDQLSVNTKTVHF